MQQLYLLDNVGSFAKPAPMRSALGTILIHGFVGLFALSLAYSPAVMTLPEHLTRVMLVAPAPPPPPPPPAPALKAAPKFQAMHTPRAFKAVLTAPAAIPEHVAILAPGVDLPPEIEVGVPGGVPGGIPGGVLAGISGGVLQPLAVPAPPQVVEVKPPKPVEPPKPQRITVDSDIQEAKLLVKAAPIYPPMARQARIQGSVRLSAVIDREGKITELKIVEGNPLLAGAACDAVLKWRYRPTYLHGEAVEVATNIIVVFHLTVG